MPPPVFCSEAWSLRTASLSRGRILAVLSHFYVDKVRRRRSDEHPTPAPESSCAAADRAFREGGVQPGRNSGRGAPPAAGLPAVHPGGPASLGPALKRSARVERVASLEARFPRPQSEQLAERHHEEDAAQHGDADSDEPHGQDGSPGLQTVPAFATPSAAPKSFRVVPKDFRVAPKSFRATLGISEPLRTAASHSGGLQSDSEGLQNGSRVLRSHSRDFRAAPKSFGATLETSEPLRTSFERPFCPSPSNTSQGRLAGGTSPMLGRYNP